MRKLWMAGLLASALFAAGCDQTRPLTPAQPEVDALFKSDTGHGAGQFATAMIRNLYVGMDFTEILNAAPAPGEPPFGLFQAIYRAHQTLIASLPEERMERIAEEIDTRSPDLVGLQEVFQVYAHGTLQFDYLELLLDALRARGARYEVAVVRTSLDITAPAMMPDGTIYFARVVDRQAILVRQGVQFWNPAAGAYAHHISVDLGIAPPVPWRRGWTAVDARVHGRTLRFINTHLETQLAAPINVLQGDELIQIAASSPYPVVLTGDFNSAANPSAPPNAVTATYGNIVAAGFIDGWTAAGGHVDGGLTCCHEEDVRNPPSGFDQRIDFVFHRGFRGTRDVEVFGDEAGDQTPSGLWPSDHAGVNARIRLP
jgi:endonuclease/exonuclease/phosphatase family metal-dependent hydrolase